MCDLEARSAIGIHWGTFKLTDESRDDPRLRLAAGLTAKGFHPGSFIAMQPGDVSEFA